MYTRNIIQLILNRLEKDVKDLEATSFRIIYFNVAESIQRDGCYESEIILNTDVGIFRFSYCLCENSDDYDFCDSDKTKISW